MKAYLCKGFGGAEDMVLSELPDPVPGDRDVLIRIHATTVSAGDWRLATRSLPPGFGLIAPLVLGLRKPRKPLLGTELAGVVEATGKAVTAFSPGDRVFAYPGVALGGHAELIAMGDDAAIARIPDGMDFTTAAALAFGGTTALDYLTRRADLKAGESVLVIGASGCVGSYAVQIASHLGAEVTGVCSTRNLDLVRALGADHVIDYTKQDFRDNGQRYDIILDTVGGASLANCRTSLSGKGRLLLIVAGLWQMLGAGFSGGKVKAGDAKENAADLRTLAGLAAAGAIRPLIDQTYDFANLPKALARVASRRKRGSVVVKVIQD